MNYKFEKILDKSYIDFLDKQMDVTIKEMFNDIAVNQKSLVEALTFVTDLIDCSDKLNESVLNEDEITDKALALAQKAMDMMSINIDKLQKNSSPEDLKVTFQPEEAYETVKKLSDRKFPDAILYFITTLVKWIKNVILAFIDKFGNAVRYLLNLKQADTKFDKMPKLSFDTISKVRKVADINYNKDKPITYRLVELPLTESINKEDIKVINESNDFKTLLEFEKDDKKSVYAIEIDVSKDLQSLQVAAQTFFDLFDKAYGSSGENLFKSDDMEALFKVFKSTVDSVKTTTVSTYDLNGKMINMNIADPGIIKNNALKTKVNLDNLKNAYTAAYTYIKNISTTITQKNLVGATQMNISYQFMSLTSYEITKSLYKITDKRIDDAEHYYKSLEKVKGDFEKISYQLEAMRNQFGSIGSNVTYASVYQKRIDDLYYAGTMITQIISMRMTGLALYLQEIKEIRAIMRNMYELTNVKGLQEILDKIKK